MSVVGDVAVCFGVFFHYTCNVFQAYIIPLRISVYYLLLYVENCV